MPRKLEIEFGDYSLILVENDGKNRRTVHLHGAGFMLGDRKLAALSINDAVIIVVQETGYSILPPAPFIQLFHAIEVFLDNMENDPLRRAAVDRVLTEHDSPDRTERLIRVPNQGEQSRNN